LGSYVRKSEVERFGLCGIQDVPVRCLPERQKLLSAMCLVAINILLRWKNTSVMLSIDMEFMLDEEKLSFLTWRPSGLTP